MYLKNYIYLIICLVFNCFVFDYRYSNDILILVFFIKWFNRWIYMLENGIVWFENLINLFICFVKNLLFWRK